MVYPGKDRLPGDHANFPSSARNCRSQCSPSQAMKDLPQTGQYRHTQRRFFLKLRVASVDHSISNQLSSNPLWWCRIRKDYERISEPDWSPLKVLSPRGQIYRKLSK